jgi:MYXO-CTERM domain-containing protein
MRIQGLVLLTCIAFIPLQRPAAAQTLTNPSGFQGSPVVSGPVISPTFPIGGGPTLTPTSIDLTPTLPVIPTPTLQTGLSTGLDSQQSDAPELPTPPSHPSEPEQDGDAQRPESSGGVTVDPPTSAAGEGGQQPSLPPTSSESAGSSSWWILIGLGLVAVFLLRSRRRPG